jgi:hypothetical protein
MRRGFSIEASAAVVDLIALPEGRSMELAFLIAACLRRDPGQRPTATAIGAHSLQMLAMGAAAAGG